MKKILGLIFLLAIIVGCEGVLTNEEIQAKIIEANSNLKSYEMDTTMGLQMSVDSKGYNMDIGTELVAHGKVDRENKRLAIVGTAKTNTVGMNMDMDTEIYVIDNVIYTKTPMLWSKQTLDEDIWRQRDQLENMVVLIDGAKIKVVGTEASEKGIFYVVEIIPDMQKVGDYMMQNQGARRGRKEAFPLCLEAAPSS